ncbi:MAG: glycosyltransferase [Rhodobacteraceae bacterium]|nr:glycosyltransferase [Paracoccaceae bacterium]
MSDGNKAQPLKLAYKAQPLKLAYIVDTLVTGGAERLVVTFAKAVKSRQDIHLTVFVLSTGETAFFKELKDAGVEVVCLPGKNLIDAARFLRLVSALRSRSIDYVHAHLITSTVVGGFAAALLGIAFATTIHNVKASTARVSKVRSFLYRRVLRMSRTTPIAVGQAVAEAALADTGQRDCLVVANAVSPEAVAPAGAGAVIRADLGLEGHRVLIAVGAIIGQKAYQDLLVAFSQVAAQTPDVLLLIVGNAPEAGRYAALQTQARDLRIDGQVRFLGLRRDIPDLLAAADLFVSASHWEGAPVSLLEAMANGLACVMTDVGDNRQILSGTGSPIVAASQPEALAEALTDMLNDHPARARARQAARTRALKHYGVEAWVNRLIGIYRDAGVRQQPQSAGGDRVPLQPDPNRKDGVS